MAQLIFTSDIEYNNNDNSHYFGNISGRVQNYISKLSKQRYNRSLMKNTNIINPKIRSLGSEQRSKIEEGFKNVNNSLNNISSNNKDMNSQFYKDHIGEVNNSPMFKNSSYSDENSGEQRFTDQFKPLVFDNKKTAVAKNAIHKSTTKSETEQSKNIQSSGKFSFINFSKDMGLGVTNDMTHCNMQPHFKSNGMIINDYNQKNINSKLNLFTGSSRDFIPKKEILQEHFKQVQPTKVGLSSNNTHKLEKYYNVSSKQKGVLPFEQQKIGPGLALSADQTSRADGGLVETFRPMPKTSNELRALNDQSETYTVPVVQGQKGSNQSVIGEVRKYGPETTKELTDDTYAVGGGVYSKPTQYGTAIVNETNRSITSTERYGPAESVNKAVRNPSTQEGQVTETFRQNFAQDEPSNVASQVSTFLSNTESFDLLENERTENPYNTYSTGADRSGYGNVAYDPTDIARTTLKEQTLYNQGYSTGARGTVNATQSRNPDYLANPTTREQTTYNQNYSTGARGENNFGQAYDSTHLANPTIREQTSYNDNYSTGARGENNFGQAYDSTHLANPTTREQTTYNDNYSTGARGENNFGQAYDSTHLANPTIREQTTYNENFTNARGENNKGQAYDSTHLANPTIREQTTYNDNYPTGARGENNFGHTYDSTHLANPTIREQTTYNDNYSTGARGENNFGHTYDSTHLANPTIREQTTYNENFTNARGENNKGQVYDSTHLANPTIREQTTYNDNYSTGARGSNTGAHTYDSTHLANPTTREQTTYNDNYSTGARGSNTGAHTYDSTHLANPTIREQTTYNENFTGSRGTNNKGQSYDPTDIARLTGNEDLAFTQHSGPARNRVDKGHAIDYKLVPAPTIKELMVKAYNLGVAQGTINKGHYFNPKDIPAQTLKEMLVHNSYLSNANRGQMTGYLAENPEARTTFREMLKYIELGALHGHDQHSSQMAERNMEHDPRKEILLEEREPTQRSHDEIQNKRVNVGSTHLRNAPQIYRDPVRFNGNNSLKLPSNYLFSNERTEASRLDPEILEQLCSNPLVNNAIMGGSNEPYQDNNDYYYNEDDLF